MADKTITELSSEESFKIQTSNVKQLKIDGSGYLLTENQIRYWIGLYGEIESKFVEEAEEDKEDGIHSGTGSYLVSVRLHRRIPNLIPMFGQKISVSHEGMSRICRDCLTYHKRGVNHMLQNSRKIIQKS